MLVWVSAIGLLLAPNFFPTSVPTALAQGARVASGGWSIVLAVFTGPGHEEAASGEAARFASEAGLVGVRTQPRRNGTVVVMGAYEGPDDPRAAQDLRTVRETLLGGRPVFGAAYLMPPTTENDPGLMPRYHLTKAREEYGPAARFSLQIAVYESPKREEAMRAAEQAAATLRREGEPAFYYHGPARSMVTVGAFTEKDAGLRGADAGPALQDLRRRHPLNLFNGDKPLLEKKVGSEKSREQASFLVEIPAN